MARVTNAVATRARRKRMLKMAKGYRGARSKFYKTAKESVQRGLSFAYRDRKVKKRMFRRLWTVRINAALRKEGLSYSKFMSLLKKMDIMLDRKILSDLAVQEENVFGQLVEMAKAK